MMCDDRKSRLTSAKAMDVLFFAVLLCLALPQRALAYLDPGTGSYILQLIVAFFVGILYTSKIVRRKVSGFVRSLFSRKRRLTDSDRG
jgi:hypothetical protein